MTQNITETLEFSELLALAKIKTYTATNSHAVNELQSATFEDVLTALSQDEIVNLPKDTISQLSTHELKQLSADQRLKLAEHAAGKLGEVDLAFSLSSIIQSGLPARKPENNMTQYHSVNGDIEVTISMPISKDISKQADIPYGIPGRYTLAWICTEIITKNTDTIYIDGEKKSFVENSINMIGTKGVRGSLRRYPESILSWAKASLSITVKTEPYLELQQDGTYEQVEMERYNGISVTDEAILWSSTNFKKSQGGYLKFSPQFVQLVKKHSVPIDHATLQEVCKTDSPHAYDLFYWCVLRVHALKNSVHSNARISWTQIREQLMPYKKSNGSVRKEVEGAIAALSAIGIELPIAASAKNLFIWIPREPIQGSIEPKTLKTSEQTKLLFS